jgi:hypothetical protein
MGNTLRTLRRDVRPRGSDGSRGPSLVDSRAIFGGGLFFIPPVGHATPDDFLATAETGLDNPATAGDPRFTCSIYQPSAGPVVGGILSDVQNGYMIFMCGYGYWDGGASNAATLNQFIEGSTTFSTGKQFTGSVPSTNPRLELTGLDPDDEGGFMGTRVLTNRPSSAALGVAEWGMFIGTESSTGFHDAYGACFVALPSEQEGAASHAGPTIGVRDTDWFVTGLSVVTYSDSADTDVTSTLNTSITIPESRSQDKWLTMCNLRVEKNGGFPTGTARTLRYFIEVNGEDLFNVRTNNTTGGANKTGRGFQLHFGLQNFNQFSACPFVIQNFPAGVLTSQTTANCHQAIGSNGSQLDNSAVTMMRTAAFSQFEYLEDTTAVIVNSDTFQDSAFTVTVDADGTSSFLLGLSTTVHQYTGQVRFEITRNGTPITNNGTDYPTLGKWDTSAFTDGSNGTGDTDNDTLPFTMFWADTPPVGSTTYTVRYRRNSGFTGSNNAMFNTRDDGSSGYRGTFFAAELKLAQEYPTSI